MRKRRLIFVAAMMALSITACGSGDGIVINGTTAAEAESDQLDGQDSPADSETTSGTKIEIITGETTAPMPAEETAAPSTEAWTEAAPVQTETTAAAQTASTTRAPAETTAARTYKVTDVKKTMYATASVRVRSSYSTSSDVLAGLSDGEKVEVTGQSENGWMRVSYKGHVGYVSKDYLTETPPATKSATSTSAGQSSTNTQTKPSTTTGAGTTPGGTTGPTANNSSSGTAGPTGPTGGSSSGTTSPGGSSGSGGGTSSGSSSVTGSVTALDPSGVTIQTSNGTSYQFVWGSDVPPLAPGDQVNISYETTSSGERKVTGVSK